MGSSENNTTSDWMSAEPDMTKAHARVRSALQTLPKETTPVGFDFRLERRLAGKPVGESRKSWSLGWLGAGVGFATAMVLAMFVFDFGGNAAISPAGMIPTATKAGPVLERSTPVTTSTEQPADVAAERTTADEKNTAEKADSLKDKTKPGALPEGAYQVVNQSGGR
ncbi:MAG: hypothetical protein H6508_04100 [Calditrichaeota bacterium]|nr:hypothetical protein [Calditrichota bacterium]MCB9366350.1 hypothetical protein [Calditrichota bacterium]